MSLDDSYLKTYNQPFSFVGIQFTLGRRFLPTAYTLRASHEGMILSWRFEASNDLVHWNLLDSRDHSFHSRASIQNLCKPGSSSTWAINLNVYDHVGSSGFCCFRLTQYATNSIGTHSLILAGFELYGQPTNPENW